MKKFLILALALMFTSCSYVSARTVYDSTGRHIVKDGTLRGQKRAAQAKLEQQNKLKAAAAAKMNYEEALHTLETPKKSNLATNKTK